MELNDVIDTINYSSWTRHGVRTDVAASVSVLVLVPSQDINVDRWVYTGQH